MPNAFLAGGGGGRPPPRGPPRPWGRRRVGGGGAVRMRWASLSANLGNLGSVRLVPRRGLSQHTGWASGGTHRLSSLRGRPAHRLGGTRQAQWCLLPVHRPGVPKDSSADLLEEPARTQTGRHEAGSVVSASGTQTGRPEGLNSAQAGRPEGLIGGPPRGAGPKPPRGRHSCR